MEPAPSPYTAYRRSQRSNAGVRSDEEDMVYYGQGTRSPRPSDRAGRAPSPREDTPEREVSASDTEYLPWADRIDVEDGSGNDETDAEDNEEHNAPVDEEAEGTCCQRGATVRRPQRAMSRVVAASTPNTTTPRRPSGCGPSASSARASGATAVGNATPGPVNAAMAARATQQERMILSLNQRIHRLEGMGDAAMRPEIARLTAARERRGRANAGDASGATRRRIDAASGHANGGARTTNRSPMGEAALERELRQAETDGVVTEGMDEWADRMEMGNKLLPKLEDGFKGVTEDAITILVYDTSVRIMNFWVTPELAEKCVARALRLTNPDLFVLLHMVWGVDAKRSGWFTRQMQVWRVSKWEQGRAFVNILHGLPYRMRANPRVRLPVRPSTEDVPRISRKEFLVQFKAGPGSMELMPWHRDAAGMPFAIEIFERAFYASFRRPIAPQLVAKTYVLAFWLFGVSGDANCDGKHAHPQGSAKRRRCSLVPRASAALDSPDDFASHAPSRARSVTRKGVPGAFAATA
ncbi:unnamed protein product [Closterium sp. Yama58-4]|nr:unnamed protein product [Closterium sp. Yama58-4]